MNLRSRVRSNATDSDIQSNGNHVYSDDEKKEKKFTLPKYAMMMLFFTVLLIEYIYSGNDEENRHEENRHDAKFRSLKLLPEKSEKQYHLVFSTDCSAYQHWQSYMLFFSAMKINQPGFVTRIASGCSEEDERNERAWHETHISIMSSQFQIHFTPAYSKVDEHYEENTSSNGGKYEDSSSWPSFCSILWFWWTME